MRPVRLDLDGFASFRDRSVVDFTDANYFAFVGPTGSGKSTVIDAMTFALYGSAPRWGSLSSIQYALAPTANRCTVRLVFDVADQRYAVAREVRRSGAQIIQRNAVLERYVDAGASGDPDADEPTESLAGEIKEVRKQIVDLLGLEFDDFCTCVVLPQGDFATFLKAGVTERQNILLKLLGAKHYDDIGKLAGRRASAAENRIDVLASQLSGYADATDEAERIARQREAELADLAAAVKTALPSIIKAADAQAEAGARRVTLTAELDRLGTVRVPADVAEIQAAVTAAEQAYAAAAEEERTAALAAMAADEAMRSGPQRQQVEETLRWREELDACTARQPDLETADRNAAQAHNDAAATLAAANDRLEVCWADLNAARSRRDDAADAVEALEQHVALLRQARVPDGVAELGERGEAVRAARDEAEAARRAAEVALAEAARAAEGLPERGALEHLLSTLTDYDQTLARLDTLRRNHEAALAEAAAVHERLRQVTAQRDAARATFEALRTEAAAADLRPQLTLGHACPVCGQQVATLPPPLRAPELMAARSLLEEAEAHVEEASSAHHRAAQRVTATETQLDLATERITELDKALGEQLPSRSSGAGRDPAADRGFVLELVGERDRALARRHEAQRACDDARDARQEAEELYRDIEQEIAGAWARLHTKRGPLLGLGAPAVDDANLATAWAGLAGWAQGRADELTAADLSAARAKLKGTEDEFVRTETLVREATTARSTAAEALTAAAVAAERAGAEQRQLVRRLDELSALLVDHPSAERARVLLAECQQREARADSARSASRMAADNRHQAEQRRDASRLEQANARAVVRRIRDGLATLGAPSVDDNDVAAAWTDLSTWSGRQLEERQARLVETDAALATAEEQLRRELQSLAATLGEHGLDPADHGIELTASGVEGAVQARRVPQAVAVEQERARGRTAEIAGRRRKATELTRAIAAETESKQVAAELQRLMSSKRFPQWLADAALDTLVADASASLLRLSNNQFDLTHERGEFYVIDHADADSRRSVRTLSGGETFQASLALALALSEQLSTLAAGGRTTLDSIFLDEGFGTLDPDALEIVAGTLENLAQEDRMVGVITHVSGLAERAPVRYEVRRDFRTSTITRLGA